MPPLLRRLCLSLFLTAAIASAAEDKPSPSPSVAEASKLFDAHKSVEAQAAFEKIAAADPKSAEAAYYLGQLALDRDDADQAVKWLEQAAALAPDKSTYFLALGDAYSIAVNHVSIFSKASVAEKCLAAYNQAVALDPDNLDARYRCLEYYRHAPGFVGGGMDKAYAEAAEIRKRDPVRGAQAFGTLYVAEKKYAKAFLMFAEVIKANPGKKALLYYLGSAAASSGQQLDRGEAALKEYLKSTPAANEPGLFLAHCRLGVIYEKKGNKDAARAEYEAALNLWPQYPPALAALKKLQGT
jgi:tetratricopeptide (TPR) repeat protein